MADLTHTPGEDATCIACQPAPWPFQRIRPERWASFSATERAQAEDAAVMALYELAVARGVPRERPGPWLTLIIGGGLPDSQCKARPVLSVVPRGQGSAA